MNKDIRTKQDIERAVKLFEQRKEILSLPADRALEQILDSKHPAAVVHSFPEQDLYFLIHDIGLKDSLPLLSLASSKQWEHMLDVEAWEKDRIDIQSAVKWLDLLFKADSNRFIKWFLDKKIEFIEFCLFKNIEVKIREHDQDPSDFGDDFFTHDDTFYVRIIDTDNLPEFKNADEDIREEFFTTFINRLAAYDHVTYQKVLLEFPSVIPAETEEETYRLRNIRLAEKGFLPFDEAIGIYQSLKPEALDKRSTKNISVTSNQDSTLPVSFYSIKLLKENNLFTDSLQMIEADNVLRQIQSEFAGLANQIISADQKPIRDKNELNNVVRKACGYISIGLELLTRGDRKPDKNRCAVLLQKYLLSQIFRLGYGLALELKWRAEKWHARSWFVKQGLLLSFWGEAWFGVLGGLLIKKPLFYDNYKTGVLYREFFSMSDIKKTENILDEIIAFDDLFSLMAIEFKPLSSKMLTYKNFILTLWARNYLGFSDELIPLTIDELGILFDDLFTDLPESDLNSDTESDRGKSNKINISMKESFLDWLTEKAGIKHYDISQRLGQTLENLFCEIESEYGHVLKKDLDPRYIYLFLVRHKKS
ncbi:MAG: hypothetical protein JRD93_11570 [Deltaproteobacteria bacterium]|nr:hypothetical protein [Deltaproteobacteria bacterium]MBW2662598.1 hypothetical protein [Deltaproteobacteria bacterium]